MYDEYDYRAQTTGSSKSVLGTVFISALTGAVMFFGLRFAEQSGWIGGGGARAVDVPSVIGMNTNDAREALRGRGLLLVLESERDDAKVPAGGVVLQRPLPGSQLGRGATVSAIVSRGVGQAAVPNVVGETAEAAARKLEAVGLKTGPTKAAPSDTVAAGLVISTAPAAGSPVLPQTAVEITLSSGRGAQGVPKFVGLKLPKAKQAIVQAGFTVGKLRYDYDSDRGAYVILRQEPAEGANAALGSAIDLVVNEP
jgi:serine/threonine-protein kinase